MAKTKTPKVSVVVPVYKTERYLAQCVDSILKQTFRNLELILVDDGSPDNSGKLCDEYELSDERVKVIHQKNSGQTIARQNGVMLATGEYILLFDSDDWLELDAVEVMVNAAYKEKADIVTFNGYFNYTNHQSAVRQPTKSGIFDKSGLMKDIYPKMVYSGRFFYFGIYASMWNKLFRRELVTPNLMATNPYVRIGEDGITTFASFLDANKVCVLGDAFLYHYRDNQASITRSYCKDQFKSALLLISSLKDMNKSRLSVYDLSTQIDYYFLYNLRSIIVEEFYYVHKKSLIGRYRYVKSMVDSTEAQSTFKKTAYAGMDRSAKLFFIMLKKRRVLLVIILAMFKAYDMRLKVYVRRKLGRY